MQFIHITTLNYGGNLRINSRASLHGDLWKLEVWTTLVKLSSEKCKRLYLNNLAPGNWQAEIKGNEDYSEYQAEYGPGVVSFHKQRRLNSGLHYTSRGKYYHLLQGAAESAFRILLWNTSSSKWMLRNNQEVFGELLGLPVIQHISWWREDGEKNLLKMQQDKMATNYEWRGSVWKLGKVFYN